MTAPTEVGQVAGWQDDPGSLVRTALQEWSDSLINLTGANRLLRLRPSRTGTIEIVRPSAEEILSGLIARRTWRFRSIDPAGETEDGQLPPATPNVLDTRKPEADLGAALRNLARRSTQEPANRYVCSRCRLEFGRSQFRSLHPPVCRDCS